MRSGGEGGLKKGPWTAAEDGILLEYVGRHGEGNWNAVQKNSGLSRCGKSCRLRWANHLRPNLKKGAFSPEEELLILRLHAQLGNKWARMAAHLPGRTDNEIKNYWNTRMKRRQRAGLPMYPPEIQRQTTVNQHLLPAVSPPPATNHAHYSAAPMALLDPFGFPTSLHHHHFTAPSLDQTRIKRSRDDKYSGFHLNFPPTLYQMPQQQFQSQYNGANLDLEPVGQPPFCSLKLELPTTQLLPESSGSGGIELLDAMLQEAESGGDLQRGVTWVQNGGNPNPGNKTTVEADDMSVLLHAMPAVGDSGSEGSNGPSSVTTTEEMGLHLASPLSVGLEWGIDSCTWNNMAQIC